MASPISSPTETTLEALARDITRRRAMVDAVTVPRNNGSRRTDSKKALLVAIESAGGRW